MLNEEGAERLIDGTLDAERSRSVVLAAQSEKPAAIYLWAGHARAGRSPGRFPWFSRKLSTPLYRDVDAYSRAVTADGQRILGSDRFPAGCDFRGTSAPHLHMYRRAAATPTDARFMTAIAAGQCTATFR